MAKYAFAAQYYRDAFPFVSYDAMRPDIAGVLLAADGTIVATDGHTLLAMRPGEAYYIAPPRDVIIPASRALFAACKAAPREATKYVVIDQPDAAGRDVTIDVVHAATAADALEPAARSVFTLRTELLDEDFPPWRKVIPAVPEQARACAPTYNARHLTRFGGVTRNDALRVIPTSDERAAAFVDLGRDDAFGILMPMYYATPKGAAAGASKPLPAVPAWALAS